MSGLLRGMLLLCGFMFLALDAHAVKPMVAAGTDHSFGLSADGKVYGWGNDRYGQLGLGRIARATAPITVPNFNLGQGTGKSRVAAGFYHNVTVKSDGSVWTWGHNYSGQLGDGTKSNRSSPTLVRGISGIVSVAAGGWHTLALKSDGSVWAWGKNDYGQLGDGTTTSRTSPVKIQGLTGVVALSAGESHSLALKSDGSVWAWGSNHKGQVDGAGATKQYVAPIKVSGIDRVVSMAAGGQHNIVLTSDGKIRTWGNDSYGQVSGVYGFKLGSELGDDPFLSSLWGLLGLEQISASVVAVTAGDSSTLVLTSDGNVWGWGYACGGLDSSTGDCSWPVQAPGITGVSLLEASNWGSFAVKSDGSLWQLGPVPSQVQGLSGVVSLGLKGNEHRIALTSDGNVWAWGSNNSGQLGDGSLIDHPVPVQIPGLADVVAVAEGLALKSDGSVLKWGESDPNPVQVQGINGVVAIAKGYGIKSDGSVWTLGGNSAPAQVQGLAGVVSLAVGSPHTDSSAGNIHILALKSDGSVWAWGGNDSGQLGDGTMTDRSTPVQVQGLTGVLSIAVGRLHSLAVKSDGTAWAWGNNAYGQLGDGTKTNSSTPIQVKGLTGVTAVATGGAILHEMSKESSSYALKSDGSVWAWGDNFYGQLGDGTAAPPNFWPLTSTTQRLTPVQVLGLTKVVAIAGGLGHALALKSDGSIWAWGNNRYGQLGDGTYASRSTYGGALNSTLSDFLDLDTAVANLLVPADKIPPFFLAASKSGDLNSLALSARVRLAPVNLDGNTLAQANRFAAGCGSGGTCQMYVAARAPAGAKTPVCAPASAFATESWWSSDAQRNWNGLAWPLPTFLSNVAPGQDQMVQVDILSNCNLIDQKGTEFYLGYGENADEMLNAGRYRVILTVPEK